MKEFSNHFQLIFLIALFLALGFDFLCIFSKDILMYQTNPQLKVFLNTLINEELIPV